MTRRYWTEQEIAILRAAYPDTPTAALATTLGVSIKRVYSAAKQLGLRKSAAYLAGPHAGRLRFGEVGAAHRFQPGKAPWNKGISFQPGGRSRETQFKPGQLSGRAARNYKPVGSLRICKDGYLERKVNDTAQPPVRRWVAVHRLVWEAAHGAIPPGHIVRFRPGRHTTEADEITAERLELVSRVDNMRRNSVQNYGPEIACAIQLRGALNRKINAKSKPDDRQDP